MCYFRATEKTEKIDKMKKVITLIFLQLLCFSYGQTKIISKINRQILSNKVLKKEISKEIGWHGGYEKTTVYLKNNVPILIEKEEKEVIHDYLTDGSEKDEIRYITARFYIANWKKNNFIRIGELINEVSESEKSKIEMPEKYVFNFNRDEIEKLIKSIQ